MQETVIAKKTNAVLVSYVVIMIIGALLAGMSVMALLQAESQYLILSIVGMVLAAITVGVGLFFIIKFARLPKNVITYKDGTLYFPKGLTCTINEVEACNAYASTNKYGVASRFGSLVLVINGKKYKYTGIDEVRQVRERLEMLRNEYFRKLMAEQHKTETPQTEPAEDPFDL
ncbi:MAG: hypothetical protein HDP34_04630 [Clostridia bacterium]|nr:hypothetical protein [Clostridia bacterium]